MCSSLGQHFEGCFPPNYQLNLFGKICFRSFVAEDYFEKYNRLYCLFFLVRSD